MPASPVDPQTRRSAKTSFEGHEDDHRLLQDIITQWEAGDLGGGDVTSVFGRQGIVVATSGDYAASQVTNDSSVAGTGVSGALNTLDAAIPTTVVELDTTATGAELDTLTDGSNADALHSHAGASVAVSVLLNSSATFDPAADHNGSGTAWDIYYPNLLHHVADGNNEGESGLYAYWVTEVDDPANPTTETVIYRDTLANQNDLEAISIVQMADGVRLLVWENTGDTVRGYARPNVVPGQTLVTGSGMTADFGWSPGAGLDTNVESMRWNEWDGMLYFLSPRGAGTDDNDTERSLWRSADWRTATAAALPATTITEVGEVVTRPEGSSPVPNANGDIDFLGEHVLLIAGVATNGGTHNNYVMYVAKNTDQDWSDVIPVAGGPNFPSVLTKTDTTGGHECIAAHKATGVIWVGPESSTSATNVLNVTLSEGPLQFPSGGGGGSVPSPTALRQIPVANSGLTGLTWMHWNVSATDPAFGADPTGTNDSGAALRAARDYLNAQDSNGTLWLPRGDYKVSTTENHTIDAVSRAVGCVIYDKITLKGDGWGHGRSGGSASTGHAGTEIFGTVAMYALIALFSDDGLPDWRGANITDLYLHDGSASNDQIDHGLILGGGLNNSTVIKVGIGYFKKAGAWGFRHMQSENAQPTQYCDIIHLDVWACDNGIWIDDNNPDSHYKYVRAMADTGATPTAGKRAFLMESSKITLENAALQFYDICFEGGNAGNNRGKHFYGKDIHVEADTGAAADSHANALKWTGTAGQREAPIVEYLDIGNPNKFASWVDLTNVEDFDFTRANARDNKWMATTDPEVTFTTSTGVFNGTVVT